MKYGDTLPQRSVLEWGPYNLDYVDIKEFIKQHTVGRPLDTNRDAKTDFEDELYAIFEGQLGRIDLFVRSKVREINCRLADCEKQVAIVRTLPARPARGYSKIEREVERASYEVQRLSRFVNVQRTGFYKLLKKYRKWTGSDRLANRIIALLESPTAFHKQDFDLHVLRVSELLVVAREGMQQQPARSNSRKPSIEICAPPSPSAADAGREAAARSRQSSTASNNHPQAPLDLETTLETSRTSDNGNIVVFWVHYDYLIEVQVLLLKQLALQTTPACVSSSRSTPSSPMLSRRNSTASFAGNDDGMGVVLLDDVDRFAGVHTSATIDRILKSGMRTAGQVRWCSRDPEALVIVADPPISSAAASSSSSSSSVQQEEENKKKKKPEKLELKIKRKYVEALLDRNTESVPVKPGQGGEDRKSEMKKIKAWFRDHPNIKPLVRIESKRTRFSSVADGALWASLSKDIRMTKIGGVTGWMVDSDDDRSRLTDGGTVDFPHAVLEVQWECTETPAFVKELARSHMVEPMQGFAIDVHAIAVLYQPKNIPAPFWLAALSRDIRKTPTTRPRHQRRGSSYNQMLSSTSSSKTSSVAAANTTQSATDYSTPGTSDGAALDSSASTCRSKRMRREKSQIQSLKGKKYWNELDQDEEEPYSVLVRSIDHNASDDDDEEEDETLSEFLKRKFVSLASFVSHPHNKKTATTKRNERSPLLPKPHPHSESSSDVDVESTAALNYHTITTSISSSSAASKSRHLGFLFLSMLIVVTTTAFSATTFAPIQQHRRRRKDLGEERSVLLDMSLFTGLVFSLVFGVLGLTTFLMSRARYSTLHTFVVWLVFAVVCLGCGAVFAMVVTDTTAP